MHEDDIKSLWMPLDRLYYYDSIFRLLDTATAISVKSASRSQYLAPCPLQEEYEALTIPCWSGRFQRSWPFDLLLRGLFLRPLYIFIWLREFRGIDFTKQNFIFRRSFPRWFIPLPTHFRR